MAAILAFLVPTAAVKPRETPESESERRAVLERVNRQAQRLQRVESRLRQEFRAADDRMRR